MEFSKAGRVEDDPEIDLVAAGGDTMFKEKEKGFFFVFNGDNCYLTGEADLQGELDKSLKLNSWSCCWRSPSELK